MNQIDLNEKINSMSQTPLLINQYFFEKNIDKINVTFEREEDMLLLLLNIFAHNFTSDYYFSDDMIQGIIRVLDNGNITINNQVLKSYKNNFVKYNDTIYNADNFIESESEKKPSYYENLFTESEQNMSWKKRIEPANVVTDVVTGGGQEDDQAILRTCSDSPDFLSMFSNLQNYIVGFLDCYQITKTFKTDIDTIKNIKNADTDMNNNYMNAVIYNNIQSTFIYFIEFLKTSKSEDKNRVLLVSQLLTLLQDAYVEKHQELNNDFSENSMEILNSEEVFEKFVLKLVQYAGIEDNSVSSGGAELEAESKEQEVKEDESEVKVDTDETKEQEAKEDDAKVDTDEVKEDEAKVDTDEVKEQEVADEAKVDTDEVKEVEDEAKVDTDEVKEVEDEAKVDTDEVKEVTDEAKEVTDEAKVDTDEVKEVTDEAKVDTDEVLEKQMIPSGKSNMITTIVQGIFLKLGIWQNIFTNLKNQNIWNKDVNPSIDTESIDIITTQNLELVYPLKDNKNNELFINQIMILKPFLLDVTPEIVIMANSVNEQLLTKMNEFYSTNLEKQKGGEKEDDEKEIDEIKEDPVKEEEPVKEEIDEIKEDPVKDEVKEEIDEVKEEPVKDEVKEEEPVKELEEKEIDEVKEEPVKEDEVKVDEEKAEVDEVKAEVDEVKAEVKDEDNDIVRNLKNTKITPINNDSNKKIDNLFELLKQNTIEIKSKTDSTDKPAPKYKFIIDNSAHLPEENELLGLYQYPTRGIFCPGASVMNTNNNCSLSSDYIRELGSSNFMFSFKSDKKELSYGGTVLFYNDDTRYQTDINIDFRLTVDSDIATINTNTILSADLNNLTSRIVYRSTIERLKYMIYQNMVVSEEDLTNLDESVLKSKMDTQHFWSLLQFNANAADFNELLGSTVMKNMGNFLQECESSLKWGGFINKFNTIVDTSDTFITENSVTPILRSVSEESNIIPYDSDGNALRLYISSDVASSFRSIYMLMNATQGINEHSIGGYFGKSGSLLVANRNIIYNNILSNKVADLEPVEEVAVVEPTDVDVDKVGTVEPVADVLEPIDTVEQTDTVETVEPIDTVETVAPVSDLADVVEPISDLADKVEPVEEIPKKKKRKPSSRKRKNTKTNNETQDKKEKKEKTKKTKSKKRKKKKKTNKTEKAELTDNTK